MGIVEIFSKMATVIYAVRIQPHTKRKRHIGTPKRDLK
jgi:hypothetical protein